MVQHQEMKLHQERRGEVDLFLENDDLVKDRAEEVDIKEKVKVSLLEEDSAGDQVDQLVQEDKDSILYYDSGVIHCFFLNPIVYFMICPCVWYI